MKTALSSRDMSLGRVAQERAQTKVLVLVLVAFVLGLFIGALWNTRKAPAEIVASVPPVSAALTVAKTSAPPVVVVDPAVLESVERAIPNASAATLASGTRILRKSALEEFQQTVQELKARQKQAEQNLVEAKEKLSPEQQKIAAKQLLELKAEGFERLKEIAANAQAQVDAFHHLKGASQ